jgi:hypothetical protein
MEWKDLDIALEFFLSCKKGEQVVLQVPSACDINEARKYIIRKLGYPSFSHPRCMQYSGRTIQIVSLADMSSDKGMNTQELFYIGRGGEDSDYLERLNKLGIDLSCVFMNWR